MLNVGYKFSYSISFCSLSTAGPLNVKGLFAGSKKLNDRKLLIVIQAPSRCLNDPLGFYFRVSRC